MRMYQSRRGLTRTDVVVIIVVCVVGVIVVCSGLVGIFLPTLINTRKAGRHFRDETQVLAIHKVMSVWASSHQGTYPLPSRLDMAGMTVKEQGAEKDTTANIFSVMIYSGLVSTEICISPTEVNPNIKEAADYEFDSPKAAVSPANALWDPAFSADFTSKKGGNISYAHLQPCGKRLSMWGTTPSPGWVLDPILSNRGPEIGSLTPNPDGSVTATPKNPASNTFLIFGRSTTWQGFIAFNDGHVDFVTQLAPSAAQVSGLLWRTYDATIAGKTVPRPDVFFCDEPDDANAANSFLGIFIKAGPKPTNFVPIWD